MTDDQLDAWAERAAIMQYDGGLSRVEAEKQAAVAVGIRGGDLPWVQAELRKREDAVWSA